MKSGLFILKYIGKIYIIYNKNFLNELIRIETRIKKPDKSN